MHLMKLFIIVIFAQLVISAAFLSSNGLVQLLGKPIQNNELLPAQNQSPETLGNSMNDDQEDIFNDTSDSISATYCQMNETSYPLKAIVVSSSSLANGVTLSLPNESTNLTNTTNGKGFLVFSNPPQSQCFTLKFPSEITDIGLIDTNTTKVYFIYDSSNETENSRSEMPSNSPERFSFPSTSHTNRACGTVICRNGGVCRSSGINKYRCQCHASNRWLGTDCSMPNPCIRIPCKNDGQCYFRTDATYRCVCKDGYTGENCQNAAEKPVVASNILYNPCEMLQPCFHGGTCLRKGNQGEYHCRCAQGYTGVNCESSNSSPTATTPLPSANICGISTYKSSADYEDRIVNGRPVYSHTWPWLVSLQTASGGSHFCGGTLVDTRHVVTASHCFDSLGTSPNVIKVVAGLLNLKQTSLSNVQQLSIDRIFRHEAYSSKTLVNDIALIRLRTPAKFNSAVTAICLPDKNGNSDPKVGRNVQIAGWGYTNSATKQLAQQLQEATIQILEVDGDLYGRPGCNAWVRRGYSMNNAKQICAMSRDTRTDSCQGDSGGPLIGNVGSKWFLYGVVSYGDSVCASSTAAGVYTRVSAYVTWIQQKLQS